MSFEFTESVNMVLPELGADFTSHTESAEGSALIVEIAAIHEGLTANYNNYSASELAASVNTWVDPYPRPVITNHDVSNEALGRVMSAKIDKDNDLSTIMLQAAIRDALAIEKFRDQRYLTGSVGGKAESAICSICGADWVKASFDSLPCEHKRGSLYKGKLAYLDIKGINWKEYSMVNTPADANSAVRSLADAVAEGEDWQNAPVFLMDMTQESIICFGESGSYDILAGKKRKEAVPLYHNTRGAFLSAFSVGEEEENDKEIDVTDPVENDDDILAASEGLSDALASGAPEGAEDQPSEDSDAPEDNVDGDEGSEGGASDDDAPAEGDSGEAPTDEGTASDDVVDPAEGDDPEDKPEDEKPEEAAGDEPAAGEGDEPEGAEGTQGEESKPEDSNEDADPEESAPDAEVIVEKDAEIARLTEENTRLRTALKKGLAERVVDLKIDLGLVETENRAKELDEHVARSASSLADSLVDLRRLVESNPELNHAPAGDLGNLFSKESGSTVVKNDKRVTMTAAEETDAAEESDPSATLENMAVEALLGRRSW